MIIKGLNEVMQPFFYFIWFREQWCLNLLNTVNSHLLGKSIAVALCLQPLKDIIILKQDFRSLLGALAVLEHFVFLPWPLKCLVLQTVSPGFVYLLKKKDRLTKRIEMTQYSFSYISWQEFSVSVCLIFEIDLCAAQASLKVTRWLNLPLSSCSSSFQSPQCWDYKQVPASLTKQLGFDRLLAAFFPSGWEGSQEY